MTALAFPTRGCTHAEPNAHANSISVSNGDRGILARVIAALCDSHVGLSPMLRPNDRKDCERGPCGHFDRALNQRHGCVEDPQQRNRQEQCAISYSMPDPQE